MEVSLIFLWTPCHNAGYTPRESILEILATTDIVRAGRRHWELCWFGLSWLEAGVRSIRVSLRSCFLCWYIAVLILYLLLKGHLPFSTKCFHNQTSLWRLAILKTSLDGGTSMRTGLLHSDRVTDLGSVSWSPLGWTYKTVCLARCRGSHENACVNVMCSVSDDLETYEELYNLLAFYRGENPSLQAGSSVFQFPLFSKVRLYWLSLTQQPRLGT